MTRPTHPYGSLTVNPDIIHRHDPLVTRWTCRHVCQNPIGLYPSRTFILPPLGFPGRSHTHSFQGVFTDRPHPDSEMTGESFSLQKVYQPQGSPSGLVSLTQCLTSLFVPFCPQPQSTTTVETVLRDTLESSVNRRDPTRKKTTLYSSYVRGGWGPSCHIDPVYTLRPPPCFPVL